MALVADAGTPGISDPGFLLVREALAAGVRLVLVPGPSAVATALSASGVPADRFVFEGFLPVKPGRRLNRLRALAELGTTVVLYDSPRIACWPRWPPSARSSARWRSWWPGGEFTLVVPAR